MDIDSMWEWLQREYDEITGSLLLDWPRLEGFIQEQRRFSAAFPYDVAIDPDIRLLIIAGVRTGARPEIPDNQEVAIAVKGIVSVRGLMRPRGEHSGDEGREIKCPVLIQAKAIRRNGKYEELEYISATITSPERA